ncbi:MAG: hypothetical protein K0R73_458 [Candidatus Midichloriaceae bacterium]|jgi:hypothetical protein|nr:hypothetical protein [Candidatus Midichloriaceae bacterium]
MAKKDISCIKRNIDEVNLTIVTFLTDMNKGVINDLTDLDVAVTNICSQISSLSKPSFTIIEPYFIGMLDRVKELKEFLSNELEATSSRIKEVDNHGKALRKYGSSAANDNL